MSALPPKADVCGANGDVGFGPIADIGCAFGRFVGGDSRHFQRPTFLIAVGSVFDLFFLQ